MSVNEFDLSIGAIASLGGVISAKLAADGVPIVLCLLIPILVGFMVRFINGSIITHFNVLSFVTTLAMGTVIGWGLSVLVHRGIDDFLKTYLRDLNGLVKRMWLAFLF